MALIDGIPDWTAVAGAALGLYAAAISSWQEVRYLRDEKSRIRVTLSTGQMLNTGDAKEKLLLSFVNVGKIPVTIATLPSITISSAKGSQFAIHSTKYPLQQRLEIYADNLAWVNWEEFTKEIDCDALQQGRVYWITGRVFDASGLLHASRPYKLHMPKPSKKPW